MAWFPEAPFLSQRKFWWVRRRCQASQRKGLTSGEVQGTSREVGNFWGTSGLLSSSTVRELPGTSGEVRGLSRSSGEPDSLPATRQICLRLSVASFRTTELSPDLLFRVACDSQGSGKEAKNLDINQFGGLSRDWMRAKYTQRLEMSCPRLSLRISSLLSSEDRSDRRLLSNSDLMNVSLVQVAATQLRESMRRASSWLRALMSSSPACSGFTQ